MNRLKREKGRNKETGCVVGQSNPGRSPCALGETLIQREFLTLNGERIHEQVEQLHKE